MGILRSALLMSLPILGICATVLYILHKKEEDDLHDTLQDVKTSRMKVIEMKIPKSTIGVVIGRQGSNIKEVQENTGTKIHFKENDDSQDYRTCYIRGTAEAAQQAESLLHEMIVNQPIIEEEEMWVPQKTVGRIIGKNGETIRTMSRMSNAKIRIDSDQGAVNVKGKPEARVVITGTREQISHAISLIEEKVDAELEAKRRMELCQATRSPRNKPKTFGTDSLSMNVQIDKKNEKFEVLTATGSDGVLEVFVSAVDTPSCFWMQVINPRSDQLDHLLSEMTDYYSVEENRALHTFNEVTVGQIVAAQFSVDERWYRAEVREVRDCNDNETEVDLYFVDYGDSEWTKRNAVYQLRTDFLKLRFQAIECTLAKVKPSGDEWSEKACELFEELTHVAQWKLLRAKVLSCDQQPRGHREGSPVPSVSLFDTSASEDINIGEELVKQGYAVWEDSSTHNSSVGSPSHHSASSINGTPERKRVGSPASSFEAESSM